MTYPDIHTESPGSWLSPIFSCIPLASCLGRRARRSTPPVPTTATEQPESTSPTSEQDLLVDRDDEDEKMRTSAGGPKATTTVAVPPWRRGLTSIKSLFTTLRPESGPPRRPRISAPSDFRHLQSGSGPLRIAPPPEDEQERFHHATHTSAQEAETHTQLRPRPNRPARPSSFRPLELSIYRRNSRRISSMMSFFEMPGSNATAIPEPAHLRERLDNDHQLVRQRTTSSVPFHLPLRPATDTASSQEDSTSSSASHSSDEQKPPAVPEKSLARGRAYTSPDIESIRARVANAMIEAERLQQRIDHVIERQSLYSASRPSTAHSMARTLPGTL